MQSLPRYKQILYKIGLAFIAVVAICVSLAIFSTILAGVLSVVIAVALYALASSVFNNRN